MPQLIFSLAQFIYILWPIFILAALIYSFQSTVHARSRKARQIGARLSRLGGRMRRNLLVTWAFLFLVWLATFFAPTDTPALIPEPWNTAVFLGGFGALLALEAARLGFFRSRVLARAELHTTRSLADLMAMDPYAFEGLITEVYRAYGFTVQHVGHSGDHGIDVEVYDPKGEHWIVQCKRYHDSVGESIIRDLYGSMISDRAQRAALVTTAEITPPARLWAQHKPIELVDGPALLDLIAGARERTEGNWFDRLAHALTRLFAPGLALAVAQSDSAPVEQAAPVERAAPVSPAVTQPLPVIAPSNGRAHSHASAHKTGEGAPICPRCHLPMVARPLRPGERADRVLYRCQNYPNCRVVTAVLKVA